MIGRSSYANVPQNPFERTAPQLPQIGRVETPKARRINAFIPDRATIATAVIYAVMWVSVGVRFDITSCKNPELGIVRQLRQENARKIAWIRRQQVRARPFPGDLSARRNGTSR